MWQKTSLSRHLNALIATNLRFPLYDVTFDQLKADEDLRKFIKKVARSVCKQGSIGETRCWDRYN